MTEGEIPIRGDPDQVCNLCGLVGSSVTEREVIADGMEESAATVYRHIRYAIALGLMTETEDGVKATNKGIDLSQTRSGEERREKYFREVIADHDVYSTLIDKLLRSPEDGTVERRDVDQHLRVGTEMDASDDSRRSAATLFLQTLEAAGIGAYKKGNAKSRSRLEITNTEALNKLLSLADDNRTSRSSLEHSESHALGGPTESIQSAQDTPDTNHRNSTTTSHITREPNIQRQSMVESQRTKAGVTFDIQLELDGTEDPSHIRELVAAVRDGLDTESSAKLDSNPESTSEVTAQDSPKTNMNESNGNGTTENATDDADTEDDAPDSSLGDFN